MHRCCAVLLEQSRPVDRGFARVDKRYSIASERIQFFVLLKGVTDTPYAVFPIRMLVQAMVIFRESLKEWTPVRRDGSANENGMQLHRHSIGS
jgi:hypothetical protein